MTKQLPRHKAIKIAQDMGYRLDAPILQSTERRPTLPLTAYPAAGKGRSTGKSFSRRAARERLTRGRRKRMLGA